jgi:hypothetical protein
VKVVINEVPEVGVPLRDVAFGSVVMRAAGGDGATYYLVGSTSDGSGDRSLITFAGSIKQADQALRVIPIAAHVVIGKAPEASDYPILANQLQEWSRNSMIQGLRLGPSEPSLQDVLRCGSQALKAVK